MFSGKSLFVVVACAVLSGCGGGSETAAKSDNGYGASWCSNVETSLQIFDSQDEPVSSFVQGETLHFVYTATNTSSQAVASEVSQCPSFGFSVAPASGGEAIADSSGLLMQCTSDWSLAAGASMTLDWDWDQSLTAGGVAAIGDYKVTYDDGAFPCEGLMDASATFSIQ